ncbi:MAG: S8 family serine peptidase [Clostridiales bacterium]|nr:S8 family serine peptidase [Clostridiales bacterium]
MAVQDQKLEDLLNLSLETPEEERARSAELETGFDAEEKTWELIVRYTGSLDELRSLGVSVEELSAGFAILTVPESLVDRVSGLSQIEYVEKPKRLFFAVNRAKAASCLNVMQEQPWGLTGRGVMTAILDSGIDYFHEDFRNADGTTRILGLWDQNLGRSFTREEINRALETGSRSLGRELVPTTDLSGHGTAVAGIAAGNGREENGKYRGVAYESELLIVKLGTERPDGFPRTTELMRAADYAVRTSSELGLPAAINISIGNTYGSHDGSSFLESFLNTIGRYGRTAIIVGSGNEGASGGHASGVLGQRLTDRVELSVAPYETGFSVQLWKAYTDQFSVSMQTPSGEILGPISERLGPSRFHWRSTQILIYYGKPSPYSQSQEIYFDLMPDEGSYVESGIWTFLLTPQRVIEGKYDFWLPSARSLNTSTQFLKPTPDTTLTIPSCAAGVITVGACHSMGNTYADFSGRGYTRLTNQVKPDLVAPGVGLMAPAVGGGYKAVTGTSFAAPVVTGSAALMMQWGMVDGNDPYLYGEKLKAYLHRGAKPLAGIESYPNPATGYGALCLRDSLPIG